SGVDLHHDGSAIDSYGGFHGQVVDIDFEVLFALPAVAIQALTEISLAIKQAHGNQRDAQIGGALNVIAGQNSKSTGVDGKRLVDSEFGGKIRDGTGPQHSRVARSPGALGFFVLAQAAIGIVDAAMQGELAGARLQSFERILIQQRDRTVIELTPAQGVDFAKQPGRIVIPAPPQITGQRPEPFLHRSNETVKGSGFAHNVRDPVRRLGEQTNFIFREDARLRGLDHQYALQHAAIDERNSQERLVIILAGFAEVFETGMT